MPKISRKENLYKKIIIVDGQSGCGKSMLSSIISSFKRVELVTYIFEIEFITRLSKFKKITDDVAVSMIKMFADQKIYNTMMGRDTNFRFDDVSSIFSYHNPSKYIDRIFEKGDETIPAKINKNNPILNFATHDLISNAEILFKSLKNNLVFIEMVRHPLYMLIQQTLNMERLTNDPRDIQIYFSHRGKELPYFTLGWEDTFIKSNSVDKAIYYMHYSSIQNTKTRNKISKNKKNKFISLSFEQFVLKPEKYIDTILKLINTDFSKNTKKILREQRVPRKKISDGMPLAIYKRCGWTPPNLSFNEIEELNVRRNFAIKNNVSNKCLKILDKLSAEYEKKYFKKLIDN